MEKEQVKSNTVIMNEDEEVECKRNLLGFRGINSVVESKKVKKKSNRLPKFIFNIKL